MLICADAVGMGQTKQLSHPTGIDEISGINGRHLLGKSITVDIGMTTV